MLLVYIGTVILNMAEEKFWRCTPRKLKALFDVHLELKGISSSDEEQLGFIDQVL